LVLVQNVDRPLDLSVSVGIQGTVLVDDKTPCIFAYIIHWWVVKYLYITCKTLASFTIHTYGNRLHFLSAY
jgi:hypothetical protein